MKCLSKKVEQNWLKESRTSPQEKIVEQSLSEIFIKLILKNILSAAFLLLVVLCAVRVFLHLVSTQRIKTGKLRDEWIIGSFSSSAVAKIRGFQNKIIRNFYPHKFVLVLQSFRDCNRPQPPLACSLWGVNKLSFKFFFHNIKFLSRTVNERAKAGKTSTFFWHSSFRLRVAQNFISCWVTAKV